jgi:hypothetical protein
MVRRRDRRGNWIEDQYAGHITNVAGDQHNTFDAAGLTALRDTHGAARLVLLVGLLMTYAGIGMFGFVVVSFIVTIWSSMGSFEQPDMSIVEALVIPWMPLGIGLAFVGGIVANLAAIFGRSGHR